MSQAGSLNSESNLPPSVATHYVTDFGTATPIANSVSILGGTGISTSALGNVITIDFTATTPLTFLADSGSATPSSNQITFAGLPSNGLSSSGTGSTITYTLAVPVLVTNGGTGTITQFTVGSVIFAGASGVYTQDNANLFWDDTNNRLGIKTNTPTAYLNLAAGSSTASNSPLKFTAGTNLTAAEAGAMEFDGTTTFVTNSVPTRQAISMMSSSFLTNRGIVLGTGTATLSVTAAGITNTVLLGQTAANPIFGQVSNAALVNSSITVTAGSGISVTGSPVSLGGAVTISASASVATTYNADAGSATPSANIIIFAGTAAQGISSSGTGNTITYTVSDATTTTKGVSSFNSTNFTVTSGAVSLVTPIPVTSGGTGTTTAFTIGSVIFSGASGVYTQDNSNLFWDDTNNRLGIGTSSPTARLNLPAGTATASSAPLKFTSGISLTAAEAGAVEFNGTTTFITNSVPTRQAVSMMASTFLTNHGVVLGAGTATLNVTAVGGTNTVLLGNTGADPIFGQVANAALVNSSITVTGGTGISVTGSPVSLGGAVTISASGSVAVTFAADSGTAAPSGGTITFAGTAAQGISSSATGSTVTYTIANATTAAKGVASFNSTNFSVTSGSVNTIQDIVSTATPTFAQLTLNGAGSTTTAQLTLNGSTNNWINFGTNGVGAPAFATRSVGTKLVLRNGIGASAADYGLGINTNTLWLGTPTTAAGFNFYAGTSSVATISGAGVFVTTGTAQATSLIATNTTNQIVLGTTLTQTISALAPATTSRIGTIRDFGADFVFAQATAAQNCFLTTTGATNVTLPTTGTLATLAGAETFTNKVSITSQSYTATNATNQLILGTTLTQTISAVAPATTSRVGTIRDFGADFVFAQATAAQNCFLTTTGATNVTLPTTGTLATLSGAETFTNKVINNSYSPSTQLAIADNIDTSKRVYFQVNAALPTGTNITMTFPLTAGTLLTADSTATVTNKSIDAAQLTGTIASGRMPALTGDVTSTVNTVSTTISNSVVTLAKMANLPANTIIGNNTGSSATPLALTVAQVRSMILSGSIVQVVSVTKIDTFSTSVPLSSGGVAVTGLSAVLVPASTSSKFYVTASLTLGSASGFVGAWIARSTTPIGIGISSGSRIGVGSRMYFNNGDVDESVSLAFLDSPATISAVVYNIYVCSETSSTSAYVNQTQNDTNNNSFGARSASTITVFEIGG